MPTGTTDIAKPCAHRISPAMLPVHPMHHTTTVFSFQFSRQKDTPASYRQHSQTLPSIGAPVAMLQINTTTPKITDSHPHRITQAHFDHVRAPGSHKTSS